MSDSSAPSIAYATVYPIAMVFLIVAVATILFSIDNQSKINKREAAHKAAQKAQ